MTKLVVCSEEYYLARLTVYAAQWKHSHVNIAARIQTLNDVRQIAAPLCEVLRLIAIAEGSIAGPAVVKRAEPYMRKGLCDADTPGGYVGMRFEILRARRRVLLYEEIPRRETVYERLFS